MHAEKLSIFLPAQLARFVEEYKISHACKSRSQVIEEALEMLRQHELEQACREAGAEQDAAWNATVADGLADETWYIYFADLSPTLGSGTNQRRPVLIVSNDANNRAASTVTIVPITSNTAKVYPFEVLLHPGDSGLPKPSKAQAQQIRTIAKEHVSGKPFGRLGMELMGKVEDALRLHLGLE